MLRLLRLFKKSSFVVLRFGLDEFLLAHERTRWMHLPLRIIFLYPRQHPRHRAPNACAWHWKSLGPLFVKFGQMLSTRRDLIPTDIADELAKLQDRVPPFPSEQAVALLEQVYGKKTGAGVPQL